MLEFEEDARKSLAEAFENQLECAAETLGIAQELGKSLTRHFEEHEGRYNPPTAAVVLLVLFQLVRRCRAAVLLWEHGYSEDAEVLTRSLFDSHLAARFIIEPQVPQPHWSDRLRQEFNRLCDLSGAGISRFTQMEFRALLYAAVDPLKLDSKTDKFKALPGFYGRLPDGFGDKMRNAAAEAERLIGPEWAAKIRKGTFHGFSQIKLLAEYCGQSDYYETLYGMQSGTSHGEGAARLMRDPSRTDLTRALSLPCAILGISLEDHEKVFSLGYADRLQKLASRIQAAFEVGDGS